MILGQNVSQKTVLLLYYRRLVFKLFANVKFTEWWKL